MSWELSDSDISPLFLYLHLLLALVLISAIGNFQSWLALQLWEVCFFTEKRFLSSELPGCFVIPFLTLKKETQYSVNTSSLIFLLQQSDVEVCLESPKPTTFSVSKLTDIFSLLFPFHPASAASLQCPFCFRLWLNTNPSPVHLTISFNSDNFLLSLQWPERIYLVHNWHIKITCWRLPDFFPEGRSTWWKEEILYFNTFPWIIKPQRL